MKKTYQAPELVVQLIHTEGLIALSLMDGKADGSDALVKGGDWDIFGEEGSTFDDSPFED